MSGLRSRVSSLLGDSRRRVFISVALVILGLLTWDEGPGEDAITAVAVVIAAAAILLDELRPSWLKAAPGWSRRPIAGSVAAAIFVISYVLNAGLSFGALLFLLGTLVFLYDARERGELGPFDPTRFTEGRSRRVLLAGTLLACFSLSASWLGDFSYYYSYDSGGYTYSGTSRTPSYNAHEVEDAQIPVLLLLALVGVVTYAGRRPRWWSVLPVAVGAGMLLYGIVKLMQNARHVEEISQGGGISVPAGGPWLFCVAAVLVLLGAFFSARGTTPAKVAEPAREAG